LGGSDARQALVGPLRVGDRGDDRVRLRRRGLRELGGGGLLRRRALRDRLSGRRRGRVRARRRPRDAGRLAGDRVRHGDPRPAGGHDPADREITITLPAAFGFNGFGAPGASVGQWDFDFGTDKVYQPPADYTIPHRAIDANQAYADTRLSGSYDAGVDSVATHSTGVGGEHILSVVLPSGGTDNNGAGGNCSYFPTDTRFTLPAGIVVLPSTPGQYDVSITAVSVDPDTGDANDGQGTPPAVYQRVVPITVPESGATASLLAAAAALGWLRRRRAATASRA